MSRRKEIYARAAVQLRTHERAVRAEQACPGAMGLYLYLLLQARGEETAGDVLEVIAYASWGAPVAYRKKQARALIEAGLVELVDDRLVVIRYGDHNDTPDVIAENRRKEREKKKGQRSPVPPVSQVMSLGDTPGTRAGTTQVVPISISLSDSGLGSGSTLEEIQAGVVRRDLNPDDDVRAVWDSQTMRREAGKPLADVWAGFCGHHAGTDFRTREGLLGRWQKWVIDQCNIAQKDRQREYDRRQRRDGPPEPAKVTPEQDRAALKILHDHLAKRAASRSA